MDTAVEIPFADGEYRFWLPLPQLVELERKTGDTSIETIFSRLNAAIGLDGDEAVYIGGGAAMIADVRETIRLGLIGGNCGQVNGEEIEVGPLLAKQLVDQYVCPARPFKEGAVIAWRILFAMIEGVRLKKKVSDEPESPSA